MLKLPLDNIVLGELWDGTSCALVADRELDRAEEALLAHLGRDTYPGELFAAVSQQLGVDRVVTVHCPAGMALGALLELTGPGVAQAKGMLPGETRQDLEENDFKIQDP